MTLQKMLWQVLASRVAGSTAIRRIGIGFRPLTGSVRALHVGGICPEGFDDPLALRLEGGLSSLDGLTDVALLWKTACGAGSVLHRPNGRGTWP